MTKAAKPATRIVRNASTGEFRLSGQALLDDMEAYRKKVSASPGAAREFLKRVGVITADGRAKRLVRG